MPNRLMPDGSERLARRLHRAEIISLSASLAVFVVIGVIGLFVWRNNSAEPVTAAPQSTPTVVARPTVAPELTSAPTAATPAPTEAVKVDIEPPPDAEKVEQPNPLDLIQTWPGDRPFSLLLLGLDQRPGEASGRTDAMVLTRIEPANNSAALISIPRDLCIANCRTDPYRINSVYQNEGPDVLRQRVGEIMGIKVDYVMVFDFYGFRRLVDFFGGVEVDVTTTIYDESYPNATDTGFEPLYIPAGVNHFDGDMALRYARSRHQDGAIARDQRQQQILLALRDQLLTPRTILQWPNFLERLRDTFKTDVPFELVPSMLKLALSIDSSRVVQGAVGFDRGLSRTVIAENGAYVLEPNVPLIQAYAAELIRNGEALPAMEGTAASPEFADRQHLEP